MSRLSHSSACASEIRPRVPTQPCRRNASIEDESTEGSGSPARETPPTRIRVVGRGIGVALDCASASWPALVATRSALFSAGLRAGDIDLVVENGVGARVAAVLGIRSAVQIDPQGDVCAAVLEALNRGAKQAVLVVTSVDGVASALVSCRRARRSPAS